MNYGTSTLSEARQPGPVDFDAVLVFWPSLHISARRAVAARGVDPDAVELANAVQLAGRARRAEVVVLQTADSQNTAST